MMTRFLSLLALLVPGPCPAAAQDETGPLRIEITEGVIEPLPFAVPVSWPTAPAARISPSASPG